LTLGVSLIGSVADLGSTLWRLWRGKPKGQPGRLAAVFVVLGMVGSVAVIAPGLVFHLSHQPLDWTPAEDGIAFESVTVTAGDGLRLSGWLIPCPDAVGSVIYCHGIGCNRTQMAPLMPFFRKLRLNILAVDFRDHGESPGHTATFGAREVEDVVGADAYLRHRFPGQPIVLCGVSYGASICVQALPRLPHVRGAWIESGFARLRDMAVHPFGCVSESVREPILSFYNTLLWLDAGFSALDVKPIDCLKDTNVPICFAHGRDDDYVFFHEGEEMFEAYQGPKDHFWSEGAGHGMNYDSAEYQQRFHDFFAGRLAESHGP
jgi:pimeloyl-ACP methyl ester carboxylesterase